MNGISNVNRGNFISDMKDRNYMQPVRLPKDKSFSKKPQAEFDLKLNCRFVLKTDGYQLAYQQITTARTP